jgi:hypothetical protein
VVNVHSVVPREQSSGLQIDGVLPAAVGVNSLRCGSVSARMNERDTFDRPSAPSDSMPPALADGSTFDVVLGCEVLYETPHAKWVAATVKQRMMHAGHAWIAGAVRDIKV